jgi:regulator of sigma E protease
VFAGYGRVYLPAVADSIVPGRPAARAGLLKGDSIAAVDGTPITRWTEVVEKISSGAGRTLDLDVVRGGGHVHIRVIPELMPVANPLTGRTEKLGRIGVAPAAREQRQPVTFGEAVQGGWDQTWSMAGSVVLVVRGLFSGGVSVSQLGGPIQIARTSVQAARSGVESLLLLIAFLSINVAILNLLPIPILDGGQIVLNVLEAVKGSAFSARTRGYILRAGLFAIVLIFVLVMFNDLRGVVESIR